MVQVLFAYISATLLSVRGVSSSIINNCPASLRHELGQVVNHLRWDGHPLLLECLNQLSCTFVGAFILPRTRLSNSFQVCLFGFKSRDMEGQGRILDIVVGVELCGVACCMRSGIVELK